MLKIIKTLFKIRIKPPRKSTGKKWKKPLPIKKPNSSDENLALFLSKIHFPLYDEKCNLKIHLSNTSIKA